MCIRDRYVDGQREGEFVLYAEDGKVLGKTVWVHGQPDGWSFESHGNGKLSNKTLYRKGAVLSLEKWGADGHPIFAWQKDAQGRDHGDTTEWHANGVRAKVIPMRDGQRHGLLQVWASDGSLLQLVPYEHGKKHGIERRWNKRGKQVWEKTWQAGVQVPAGQ